MLAIISPAKNLGFEDAKDTPTHTVPDFLDDSEKLITKLRTISRKKLGTLMSISPQLAELNFQRYQEWHLPFDETNSRPSIQVFRGDVYRGMKIQEFSNDDLNFAQDHLRILSGLYGLLRPFDLIQPYRLEMGTRLPVRRRKNLYDFWDGKITEAINQALDQQKEKVLVNLASNEYWKSVKPSLVRGRILTCSFRDFKNGEYRTVMTFAKIARGMMTSYIIRNRIEASEDLKGFDVLGYGYNDRLSTEDEWVFTREKAIPFV